MEKKGICSLCVNDGGCTFLRQFPVVQCEEFTICQVQKSAEIGKREQRKIKLIESE